MAWIRRLPSGRWAATVRLASGKRRTRTHDLKSVVADWAADLERDVRHGVALDPQAGRTTVVELWELTRRSRRLARASRKRDESQWRNHVGPRWAGEAVGPITRPDVRAWVVEMEAAGVGAATIQGALGVLRAILATAVDARKIRDNPAVGVGAPPASAHLDRVLTHAEDEALLAALDRVAPGRPDGRLLAELLRYCGCRWEEAAAIDREHVRLHDRLIDLGPVAERDRTIRLYPKSAAGVRTVPVPDHLWPRVRERTLATEPGGLLIPAPGGGGVLDYSNWYHRTWRAALLGLPERRPVRGHPHRPAVAGAGLADPQPTPHDLRHTYGTRLAEDRVPPHEIMALLGHSSLKAVQRYLHAGEDRFARAREAVRRGRGEVATRRSQRAQRA